MKEKARVIVFHAHSKRDCKTPQEAVIFFSLQR